MKKTIRGVRFDTETATKIAAVKSDDWSVTLYRQPRAGRYFLVGHFPLLLQPVTFRPLSKQGAHKWASKYLADRPAFQHLKK